MRLELRTSGPERVKVLDGGEGDDPDEIPLDVPRREPRGLSERVAHHDAPVDREQNYDPDGDVTECVVAELVELTRDRVKFLVHDQIHGAQPAWYDSNRQENQVGEGHDGEIVRRGRTSHPLPRHDEQDENVARGSD